MTEATTLQQKFRPVLLDGDSCLYLNDEDPAAICAILHIKNGLYTGHTTRLHLESGNEVLILDSCLPEASLLSKVLGFPVEEYRYTKEAPTKFRWVGLHPCKAHKPICYEPPPFQFLGANYDKSVVATGYCVFCRLAIIGNYTREGNYVGGIQPRRVR